MGTKITYPHSATAETLYALIFNSAGQVADVVASAMDTYATADLGDYDTALTELGTASRLYQFTVPAFLVAGGYHFSIFKRAGGSPAEGDLRVGVGAFSWTGSALGEMALEPTTLGRTFDVTATGAGGIDWGNVENATTAVNLSATNIDVDQVVASVSGAVGSVATGGITAASIADGAIDAATFAAGAITAAAIATDAIDADALKADAITEIQSGLATAADLATVDGNVDSILADTNELQTDWANGGRLDLILDARASQTSVDDLPTNAELATALGTADDATLAAIAALNDLSTADVDARLAAIGLDHLISAAVVGADIADNSIIAKLVSKSATADWDSYVNTTDSLEANRDRGDAAWITATGFSTHSAADVWSVATRVLTAGTNIVLAKGTGVTGFNDLSAAQVNAEVDAALSDVGLTTTVTGRIDVAVSTRLASADYTAPLDAAGIRGAVGLASANLDTQLADIPTAAELEARTLVAANYFDPAADTVARVTLVDTTTTNTDMRGTDGAALASAYTAARAAKLDNLDAAVSSRLASASYTAPLDAAGIRTAVGLGAANLDTQFAALPTATENADALLARSITHVEATAEDKHCLALLVAQATNASESGGTLTAKKPSDDTAWFTYTVTTDASADLITAIS